MGLSILDIFGVTDNLKNTLYKGKRFIKQQTLFVNKSIIDRKSLSLYNIVIYARNGQCRCQWRYNLAITDYKVWKSV